MKVTAQIYQKRGSRWRYLCDVSDDLDAGRAGLGDDRGYLDFALQTARIFPNHEIVVQDPHNAGIKFAWRSMRVVGFDEPGVQKVRVRESLKREIPRDQTLGYIEVIRKQKA